MKYVIHFTPLFDNIKKIVQESAIGLFYCKEDFHLGNEVVSKAVHPMVSFSEYSLLNIDNKIITYGKFGIAFKKSWVTKNKLHSVLYIDRDSLIAHSLSDLLRARRPSANNNLPASVRLSIMMIKCFTKNAVGHNSHFNIDNFNFKNENEWRYVPTKSQIDNNLISQSKSKYLKKKDFYNDKLKMYPLKFKKSDIEFIFVETQEQKSELIKLFEFDKEKIRISKWSTQWKK